MADQIAEKLAWLLLQGVADDRLASVNITAVKLSPCLRYAKVYWVVLNPEQDTPQERRRLERLLARAAGHLRKHLSRTLRLKATPELTFVLDDSLEQSRRIRSLLQSETDAVDAKSSEEL